MSYGKIIVGDGGQDQKELEVADYMQTMYPGNRVVHVAKIEDGSYTISLENLQSSGRAPQQAMRLSEESLIAVMVGIQMYFQIKGMDSVVMLTDMMNGKDIQYVCSDNLDPKIKL